jgi:hypothetical protein
MAEEIYILHWNAPRLYVVHTLPMLFIFKISILVFNFTTGWRRLHCEDLYDLHSPNIIRVNKPRKRWAGRVARMGEMRSAYRILVGSREGRNHLEDSGIDGKIVLKWIFKKWEGAWAGLIWLRIGTGGGLL